MPELYYFAKFCARGVAIKHKFRAKPQNVDNKRFDSKLEAQWYQTLKRNQESGDLLFFLRQVPFDLPGNVKYRADFMEFWANGEVVITDCKGFDTPHSKMKRKQVEDIYPVNIQLITKSTKRI